MQLPWTELTPRAPQYQPGPTTSCYVVMRDGVRIAVDVTLPVAAHKPLPAILRQTRYHRRMALQPPLDRLQLRRLFDRQFDARRYFVRRGYAWIDVCVRGSGASGGQRPVPWSLDERADGLELLEWIVRQPWSNGRVGARGVSYDGTAAEFLMWHGHPALRAVAPRFSLFDVYEDIAMPGGIHLAQFTQNWARFNDALDRNQFNEVLSLIFGLSRTGRAQLAESSYAAPGDRLVAKLLGYHEPMRHVIGRLVRGVAPTEDDPDAALLRAHLQARQPALDVHAAGTKMTYRDDGGLVDADPTLGVDDFSPHAAIDQLPTSVPVFHYTGWFDGAYQRAAMKRFATLDDPGQRLLIGPWEHGGEQNVSAWNPSRSPDFDHEAELLRFFDAHLRDDPVARADWYDSPRVRYFTIGAEAWRAAETWPPPGFEPSRLHLAPGGVLSRSAKSGRDALTVTGRHGTGQASRWRSLLPMLSITHYLPRAGEVLTYDTGPLPRDTEVTGHPLIHVEMESTTDDPRLFVYLEDVDPDGTAHYVTEGQLRALHRRMKRERPASHASLPFRSFRRRDRRDAEPGERIVFEFDLLPLSYLFQAGHRVRLVLAGSDVDHFDIGPHGTHTIDLRSSWIELPVPTASPLGL